MNEIYIFEIQNIYVNEVTSNELKDFLESQNKPYHRHPNETDSDEVFENLHLGNVYG